MEPPCHTGCLSDDSSEKSPQKGRRRRLREMDDGKCSVCLNPAGPHIYYGARVGDRKCYNVRLFCPGLSAMQGLLQAVCGAIPRVHLLQGEAVPDCLRWKEGLQILQIYGKE